MNKERNLVPTVLREEAQESEGVKWGNSNVSSGSYLWTQGLCNPYYSTSAPPVSGSWPVKHIAGCDIH